jgi:zinc finger protein 830
MSAAFKIALEKKKQKQNELRRLMSEKKSQRSAGETSNRLEHPLAKYDSAGNLMCALCKSIVKSEAVWQVHLNAKKHKENVQLAKQLKEQLEKAPQSIGGLKRSIEVLHSDVPAKKPKGILKNSTATKTTVEIQAPSENGSKTDEKSGLPEDFFDSTNKTRKSTEKSASEPMEVDEDKLPDGFFDDPVKDAKAHNVPYKDPNDEEWERFQKEIKEATSKSLAIISEEVQESTVERQIDEIDEQIRNWARFVLFCLKFLKPENFNKIHFQSPRS